MFKRWIPWKFLIRRTAKAYGLIDPINLLVRVRRFAQPSEVQEPIELLRAGVLFHARGLINTKAIQHNLDWIWPYWVERQFNPHDSSFIPRGFAFSHVNMTHRNWTAIGLPNLDLYPLVDPRGLITPIYDGWSLDFWLISPDGIQLFPSKQGNVVQWLDLENTVQVITSAYKEGQLLQTKTSLDIDNYDRPYLNVEAKATSNYQGWLVAVIRPYNPEGIQFIHKIDYITSSFTWKVNNKNKILFNEPPDKVLFSEYSQGDVVHKIDENADEQTISCNVGMATSAAFFPLTGREKENKIDMTIPLGDTKGIKDMPIGKRGDQIWQDHLNGTAVLKIPDRKISYLYETSVRTLLLLSSKDIFPGPYTYKRFWFRDACFMINALIVLGCLKRSRYLLGFFPARQKLTGYFHSQEGEWDSNGQVLWIINQFHQFSNSHLPQEWKEVIAKGAKWIKRKRIKSTTNALHAGLFPPGFSAEHLGPNDYYYWDNFWSLAGLRAAADLMGQVKDRYLQDEFSKEANDLEQCIEKSIIDSLPRRKNYDGLPASPYRRMDAGAIGSLVADYPLKLTPPRDSRITKTIAFLKEHCFYKGGFFQDMIHSGINPYLTLCIAQTLLRNGDTIYQQLIERVADLASPTGQWPEAIHPITAGGCMGDGQHAWAAAEWIMMIRNLFVREDLDKLIIGSGIFSQWLLDSREIQFGPTQTPYGPIKLTFFRKDQSLYLEITGGNYTDNIPLSIQVPGYHREEVNEINQTVRLSPIRDS
ncbi:MAG TPA: hypothetical protein VKN82_08525 [Desulfohalobiaceae bacterium]|nr:hypothetical protein [Desulfohalobiaceae bacterium]